MKRILVVLVSVLSLTPTFAWNHTGHKVVAELAWRNLSAGKQKALGELLKQHPHYSLCSPQMCQQAWTAMNGHS